MSSIEPVCHIDFESRSACPLRKAGAHRYSVDPSTEVLCLAFRLPYWEEGQVDLWHPEFKHLGMPEADCEGLPDLLNWVEAGGLVMAHNFQFERCMWGAIMVPRYGWPALRTGQGRCSAAQAAALALPRALGDAGAALGLDILKDDTGHKVMMKVSKPRKSRKKERETWEKTGEMPPAVLWHESRELFEQLFAYCKQDILSEEALSTAIPPLSADETLVYTMDQTINARGFQIDREAVDCALTLIAKETRTLNKELSALTDGKVKKATQRARMLEWFEGEGLDLENTQKETIDAALVSTDVILSPPARRGLEIVRTLGRSSTAKYQSMSNWMDPNDDRVRGGLLYHGATTGRWSGSGVQPHNFVRGAVEEMDLLWTALCQGNMPTAVCFKKDQAATDIMSALAQGLRGAIVAAPGRSLYVADYASIEARVLFWLAGEEEALESFRLGADIYKDMAASIYHILVDEVDKDQRQLGKQAILGCFAGETPVLTPRGWVAITSITKDDRVWDGEAWVLHDGIIEQGIKETICLKNLQVTPDHSVLIGKQWMPAAQVAHDAKLLFRALVTGSENLPFVATSKGLVVEQATSSSNVPVEIHHTESLIQIFGKVLRRVVVRALESSLIIGVKSFMATPIFSRTMHTGHGCSTELVQLSTDVRTQNARPMQTMEDGVFVSSRHGWDQLKDAVHSLLTSSPFRVGMNRSWNWIAQIITKGINPAIYGSYLNPLIWEIGVKSPSCSTESKSWKPVYDIANAGPKHRFTVLTDSGPLLVHNCGYQMGWVKFQATCAKYGIIISDELAQSVVSAYRAKFWRIKQFWADVESAAIRAVHATKHCDCGYTRWFREGIFLFCELPSGRRLAYPYPEVKQRETPWGELKSALTFKGVDAYTRKWKRQHTYGGSLVENITQAVARDCLAAAMLRCEANGYPVVLSVHDEVISERAGGSLAEFNALMAEVPEWGDGLPIAIESFNATRYRK